MFVFAAAMAVLVVFAVKALAAEIAQGEFEVAFEAV